MVLLGIVLGVTALYVAREVFIPVALSIMLTFLLGPLVTRLQRRGVPRVPSVILVVVVAAAIFTALGWAVTRQITSLTGNLPLYRSNIQRTIGDLGGARKGSAIEKAEQAVAEVVKDLNQTEEPADKREAGIGRRLRPSPSS